MSDGTKQGTSWIWGGSSQEWMEALREHHTIHSPASWSTPANVTVAAPPTPATAPSPSLKEMIDEREKTHGDFADVSRVAQDIKAALSCAPNNEALSPLQREALGMIASKIGRIMSGNPNEVDHWDDIAGYAKLVADRVR